jgi:hypothetical protein
MDGGGLRSSKLRREAAKQQERRQAEPIRVGI